MTGTIIAFKKSDKEPLSHGEIFARLGYALGGLPDQDIQAIIELVEVLAGECRGISRTELSG